MEVGPGDGALRFGLVRKQNAPAGGGVALFLGDGIGVAADADAGVADEEIRDLHGSDDLGIVAGAFRFVMVAGGVDQDVGQIVVPQVERSEFGVINPEQLAFDLTTFAGAGDLDAMDLVKMFRERRSHDDLADVMDQARDVVDFVDWGEDPGEHFPGEDGGADAMLPKGFPGPACLCDRSVAILHCLMLPHLHDANAQLYARLHGVL